MLAGLSGGAIIAPLVAAGLNRDQIFELLSEMSFQRIVNLSFHSLEIIDHTKFTEFFRDILPIKTFEKLPTPVLIYATDVKKQETLVIETGDIASAITASCSIFPLMQPVKRRGRLLTDGGYSSYYGAQHLRDRGMQKVIGVDVTGISEGNSPPFFRSFYLSLNAALTSNSRFELKEYPVDLDIRINLKAPTIFNLTEHRDDIYKIGDETAKKYFRKIKKVYG